MAVPRYRNTGRPFRDGVALGLSGFGIVLIRALFKGRLNEWSDFVPLSVIGTVFVVLGGLIGFAWGRFRKRKGASSSVD